MSLTVFWYRRDLRLDDNAGLFHALKEAGSKVQPIFIFDSEILKRLEPSDRRVPFLHDTLAALKAQLQAAGSDLWVYHGKPLEIFNDLISKQAVKAIYTNHDYEPYALQRDQKVADLCKNKGVIFKSFKDQVVFEKSEILTDAKKPYTVFTPFKRKWLATLSPNHLKAYPVKQHIQALYQTKESLALPTLKEMGFERDAGFVYPATTLSKGILKNYATQRDFPALNSTSRLGLHLRFGTVSVRDLVRQAQGASEVWLSELIWREFFMQILFHFPHVEKASFRPDYDKVEWRQNAADFQKWKEGRTGYPLVDAGMRELAATGHMHNRVRMVTASFLTKHLLIYWLEGERYFASQLLDFELASNNGNWQWAAGTGCDAAPYFRVFNPESQVEKFDGKLEYVKKWVPEFGTAKYPAPMIEHREARDRALKAFHKALKGKPQ